MTVRYWLLKSEPDVYSIDELAAQKSRTDHWEGIRNYEARNFIRDKMRKGDLGFFYHSNCDRPGIVGIIEIVGEAYPDFTALDPRHKYYDPRSDPENPRWFMVDVGLVRKLKRPITLRELKTHEALKHMRLLQRGSRLSIMPVTKKDWDFILKLESK